MIRRIIYSSIAVLLGAVLLFFPPLISYVRTEGFLFDLASFLGDYPGFRFPLGAILLSTGLLGVAFEITDLIRKNTDYVIQQSGDGDFGNAELRFPWWAIGAQDPKIYKNLASLNRYDDATLSLDKERIKDFFDSLATKKRMAFLAVALFPLLVYSGFVVGNAGKRVTYFHYDRVRSKAIRLKTGKRTAFFCECEKGGNPAGSDHIVCFSVSYPIDKTAVERQFPESKIIFYSLLKTDTESVRNLSDLNGLADDMRTAIECIKDAQTVKVLLSCPAELCFAFGQCLNSPGLPLLSIYNFDRRCPDGPWNWFININEHAR